MNTRFMPPLLASHNKGYSLLIAILIIGVMLSFISVSLHTQHITVTQEQQRLEHRSQAREINRACTEQILLEINWFSFGEETIDLLEGECTYMINSYGWFGKKITVQGIYRNMHVETHLILDQVYPDPHIASSEEVGDI